MRNLYYDTVLYSEEALRLLIKTVGADRCLFGTECPGVGSTIDKATGRTMDDIRPVHRRLRMAERGRQEGDLRGQRAKGVPHLACAVPHDRTKEVSNLARIVLGIGTSHGPMLSTPPENWDLRVADDVRSIHHFKGRTWSFEELVELRKEEHLENQIGVDVWKARHTACRTAIESLADAFAEAKPDVAVIVGNDQMEIFDEVDHPRLQRDVGR